MPYVLTPGKHTKNYGKSPCLMGKFTINGHFQQLCQSLPEGKPMGFWTPDGTRETPYLCENRTGSSWIYFVISTMGIIISGEMQNKKYVHHPEGGKPSGKLTELTVCELENHHL